MIFDFLEIPNVYSRFCDVSELDFLFKEFIDYFVRNVFLAISLFSFYINIIYRIFYLFINNQTIYLFILIPLYFK
jgi:hypothetical protein